MYGMKWMKAAILCKRSDNASHTIMVCDPDIRLHEISISMDLASNLVVSEYVNSYNIETINFKSNLHLHAKEILFTRPNEELIHVKKQISYKLVTWYAGHCRMEKPTETKRVTADYGLCKPL
jgi:DNA-directed RNA polymerase beta' subunit